VYSLKPKFQELLRPAARLLISRGATANEVTVAAGVLSAATGLLVVFYRSSPRAFLALPLVLFIRMSLNAIDGLMACEFNQRTSLGTYLNELGDVASDAFLILPFAYVPGIDPIWIGIVIVLATISEMAGTVGAMVGATRRYDGPMGKSDRALVFGVLAFWIGCGSPGLSRLPALSQLLPLAAPILSALIALTIRNRIRGGLSEAGLIVENTHA
jgi:CDP-diacylglycerol--glycerol-3-phosphate 3-phosphatidyltransferase